MFRSAVHHVLFAERVMPVIADLETTLAVNGDELDVKSKARLGRLQLGAQAEMARVRDLVMPPGNDDEDTTDG